ncbi:MAG: ASKHA domain-containing protein [Treponema sp.]|nr:ASKHA domain-containing protein [Treponema sp.]
MLNNCTKNCIVCGKCSSFPILTEFNDKLNDSINFQQRDGYGIAIDIGTTTVVLALLDLSNGKILNRRNFLNPQRKFGSDVISRIKAANEGHLDELRSLIKESLLKCLNELLEFQKIQSNQIIDISIAGNTTMIYLLLGFPCESLGAAPFKPSFNLALQYNFNDIFLTQDFTCPVQIIPWFAAFVGGDIMAGLLHVIPQEKNRFLLIDLGTNGELVLYNNGKLTVTSTAAGSAFENINGNAYENTSDLQLAKSAIRSGLEILLETNNLVYKDIDAVYLAGGIGQVMDINYAVTIGLIPLELKNICSAIGNASLGGAVCTLLSPNLSNIKIKNLLSDFTEINLAFHPNFNEYFTEYLSF